MEVERHKGRIDGQGGREGERGRAVIRNVGERRLERAASSSVIFLSLIYTHTLPLLDIFHAS